MFYATAAHILATVLLLAPFAAASGQTSPASSAQTSPPQSAPAPAATSPWSVEVTHDRATATNYGIRSIWTTDRLQAGWVLPERGGLFVSTERQVRGSLVDASVGARGYRRLGDWTIAAGGSATPASSFLARASADIELSRRIAGTLVASAGYRYLDFRRLDVHQVQPALTWYHPRGEVESRLYISHNTASGRTSPTLQIRTAYQADRRVQATGGVAYGDRIFDIASLPTGASHSQLGFASVRLGLTAHDFISLGTAVAHEDPAFSYRLFFIGYRRAF